MGEGGSCLGGVCALLALRFKLRSRFYVWAGALRAAVLPRSGKGLATVETVAAFQVMRLQFMAGMRLDNCTGARLPNHGA